MVLESDVSGEYKRPFDYLFHSKCHAQKNQLIGQSYARRYMLSHENSNGLTHRSYLTDGFNIFLHLNLPGNQEQVMSPRIIDAESFLFPCSGSTAPSRRAFTPVYLQKGLERPQPP